MTTQLILSTSPSAALPFTFKINKAVTAGRAGPAPALKLWVMTGHTKALNQIQLHARQESTELTFSTGNKWATVILWVVFSFILKLLLPKHLSLSYLFHYIYEGIKGAVKLQTMVKNGRFLWHKVWQHYFKQLGHFSAPATSEHSLPLSITYSESRKVALAAPRAGGLRASGESHVHPGPISI